MIPFRIPAEFAAQVDLGQVVRYGALLKDSQTGRIVAHLQETGLLQEVLARGGASVLNGLNPISSFVSVVQNQKMIHQLGTLQTTLGAVQGMQSLGLATGIVGIGFTVASTAFLSHKLSRVETELKGVQNQLGQLSQNILESGIFSAVGQIKTALSRLAESEVRFESRSVLLSEIEEKLETEGQILRDGIVRTVESEAIDEIVLRGALSALATSSDVVGRIVAERDGSVAAKRVAERHAENFVHLSIKMPADLFLERLVGDDVNVRSEQLAFDLKEARARLATRPEYYDTLNNLGLDATEVLAKAREEKAEPILLLESA